MTTTEIGIDEIATKSQLQNVLVRMIRRDGGTQARTGNNEETIELYAEAMRDGRWEWNEANAVVVYHDGSATWLADGFHRVEACFRADQDRVFARVIPGTRRDAVLYAAGANAQHGLRRTRADVRRAIEVLLRDAEWGKWSNAEIARRAKTTDKTVSTVRSELELSSEIPRIEERTVTRNGSTYTQAAARPATPPAPPAPTEAIRSVAYAAEIAGIYRQRIAATETTAELDVIKKEIAADMRLSPSGVIDLAAQISSRLTAAPPASPAAPAEPVAPTITTTSPLDAVSEALRKNDTKAASAAIHLISNDEERKRAYAAVDARIDGKSLDTVLSMLEQPTTPALSAFPPGSVEAGIGAIARRLQSGSQISTDAPWAEKLRIQLDAARETMQPAVYETWSARIGAVQAALVKAAVNAAIEAPQAAPVKKTTSHAMLLEYAESMLAGVVVVIPDTAIHLVAALVCWEYEPYSGDDPREALFQTLKILAKDNLGVVDTAIQWQKGI